MSFLAVFIFIAWIIYRAGRKIAKDGGKGAGPAARQAGAAPGPADSARRGTGADGAVYTVPVHAQKPRPQSKAAANARREQMLEREKWRAAKRQQDDAEQLHSVRVDSCEGRLKSLRVLYEAGILDRTEYSERVARTKARHAHGTMP